MGFIYIVYCNICAEKIKTPDRKLMNTVMVCEGCRRLDSLLSAVSSPDLSESESSKSCMPEPEKPKSEKPKPQKVEIKKEESLPMIKAEPLPKKIPVIARTLPEFVRWLVRNRYSRRDYEYIELDRDVRELRTKYFVVLNEANLRSDWKAINAYFLEMQPVLIVE